jgi:2,3-bisphosphoglycerate-dependent phosphoglycerate mutase
MLSRLSTPCRSLSSRSSLAASVLQLSNLAAKRSKYTLVLVRHGESTWNEENKFTGWYDCPLSVKGELEAKAAGVALNKAGYSFDVAFTSFLKRAIRTLWHSLEQTDCMQIPIKNAWQLNERHYGALQGLDKQATVAKYGIDQVTVWRRSYDVPPPACDVSSEHYPANIDKYKSIPEACTISTESLKTTLDRVLPYWHSDIAPQIKSGKKVVIAAHGNSLRALVKYLDNIPEDVITELNIPTGVPLIYHLDENLKPIPHPEAFAPLQGEYLGNKEEIRKRIDGVKNQTK